MLAAGLQGLQVAAVLHAGSSERSKQRSPRTYPHGMLPELP